MKRAPPPPAVHSSICWSPSELPNANTGRRPMKRSMPTGLPVLSSMKSILGSRIRRGLPPLNWYCARAPSPDWLRSATSRHIEGSVAHGLSEFYLAFKLLDFTACARRDGFEIEGHLPDLASECV